MPNAKVIMVQGTSSDAGKSILVTALCRIFKQDGYSVAPFKAQNMSLNSFVTPDGGEIGRAQAVQAEAAGIQPSVDMNPVLLKPEADHRSQVIVRGRVTGHINARDFLERKKVLWPEIVKSLDRLRKQYEIVVIEGAGSPAEINLKKGDVVNMRVARYAGAPVLLVGDIDRGGVFASFVGTMALLDARERTHVKAFVVNKFRGDVSLLEPGLRMLEKRTHVTVAGVVPFVKDLRIAQEDSVAIEKKRSSVRKLIDIAVVYLPHISNFDDFAPFEAEPEVSLRYVKEPSELGKLDLIIIPGSKTTVADLQAIRKNGLSDEVLRQAKSGVPIIGVCGGFQMLGKHIYDPHLVESKVKKTAGLGLLPVSTTFAEDKQTHQVRGMPTFKKGLLSSCDGEIVGYEIHMGATSHAAQISSPFTLRRRGGEKVMDGAINRDGSIFGTYVHGLLDNASVKQSILKYLAVRKGVKLRDIVSFDKQSEYDRLADVVRGSLDMNLIYKTVGVKPWLAK